MDFTKQQLAAINDEPQGNILVSASAGSGKTRVLVERVIRKIISGTSIDQLLIVTFTKAAAKEMKDRIQLALQARLNDAVTRKDVKLQRHLIRQIRKLPVADISTMDSFCQRVVQSYYYVIDLDPDFRILGDRTEIQLLRDQVWENLREDLYENDTDGSFVRLVDNFANDRSDDGLTDLIEQLYDYSNVNQNQQVWLNQLAAHYQIKAPLPQSNLYQNDIKPAIEDHLKQMILKYQAGLDFIYHSSDDLSKEAQYLKQSIEVVQAALEHLNDASWNDMQQLFNSAPIKASFPRGRGDDHKSVKQFNDDAKAIWTKQIGEAYFNFDEATNLKIMHESYALIQTLVDVVKRFSNAYMRLKRQQHALEFIDIEHAAFDILTSAKRSGEVRQNFQNQYQEIMVDEYQDNNRLQDAILKAVANLDSDGQTNDLFMVGDVKQSIYRFRLGDPSIFMGRQRAYQKDQKKNLNINLADNFRSAQNIDYFINLIFTQIMDRQVGEIDYDDDAKLKFGATYYPDELNAQVELMLYDSGQVNDEKQQLVDEKFQVSDDAHGQLEMVAQKIDELVGSEPILDKQTGKLRPVQYSDIAILSSTRSQNLILSDIFNQHQIPITVSGKDSYFKTTEIQIMMALLRIIDNPYQDIPLVAVLRSPMVGLDENQLAYIRINKNTGDYYHAVQHFVQNYANLTKEADFGEIVYRKLTAFLKQLDDFRDYAHHHELVDLIWYIYQQTGFLDYVGGMPAGKQRQVNLHALYQRAADYERTSFKGLFQFVRFIEKMQKHDQDLAEPVEIVDDNTVKVMTIHGSKGLEFPVVFLIDLQRQFNTRETKRRFVLNDKLGLGIDYIDQAHRIKMMTLPKRIVLDQIQSENQAEEMRKLYVALTRAEQQLYLVGIAKATAKLSGEENLIKQWRAASLSPHLVLDAAFRNGQHSALDWIGTALYRHPQFKLNDGDSDPLFDKDLSCFRVTFEGPATVKQSKSTGDSQTSKKWLEEAFQHPQAINVDQFDQVMDMVYPNQAATHTTAYQAVSEIKRRFDDPDAADMGFLTSSDHGMEQSDRYVTSQFATPQFLQTVEHPTAAEIGTATHLILQKMDVSQTPTKESIQHLIQRLVTDRLLTPEVAAQINVAGIQTFFNSEIGQLILQHPDALHREVPFSMLLSAHTIFSNLNENADDQVLIHGIIDGYLVLDDQVILFDYKTDYVGNRKRKQQIQKIIHRYRGQVNLYAIALSQILHREVKGKYLYLLSADQLVSLTN